MVAFGCSTGWLVVVDLEQAFQCAGRMAEVEVVAGHSAVNSVLVAVASPLLPCHQLLCGALSLPYPSL